LAQTGTVPRGVRERTVEQNASFPVKNCLVCGRVIQMNQATTLLLFLANYSSIEASKYFQFVGKDIYLIIYFDICVELSNWEDNVCLTVSKPLFHRVHCTPDPTAHWRRAAFKGQSLERGERSRVSTIKVKSQDAFGHSNFC
jgi:hypothetical protein